MKKFCFLLAGVLLVVLCGCSIHHSNSFYEGTFTNDTCKLVITAIDKETYKSKNGVNVVPVKLK